ncbi:unnamed protein product [Cutaneotrichosporon oleaginosum]
MSAWSPPASWLVPSRSRSSSSASHPSDVSLSSLGERQLLLTGRPSTPSYSFETEPPQALAKSMQCPRLTRLCPASGGAHEPRSRAEDMSLLLSQVSFTLVPFGLLT